MATSNRAPGNANAAHGNSPTGPRRLARWMQIDSPSRRLILAGSVYLVATLVFALFAGRERLTEHTPFNHYALLADAWLHGRQDLPNGPPPYAMGNDFAQFHGKTYISFPPLPAILMLPFVKLAGSPEAFRDGQFIIELAGIAPAVLFLVLEKLRRTRRSPRNERENLALSLLYAFGTVYFFTAVEGTVWFAAMVVASAASGLYALWALDAERPALAGAMMASLYLSRPSAIWAAPLFALEALRVSTSGGPPLTGGLVDRARTLWQRLDRPALLSRYAAFSLPILAAFSFIAWMNWSRYGRLTPVYFDHEFLAVGWHGRIMKWGLFGYHYLSKNLGVALSSLPWLPPVTGGDLRGAPFQINEHGLAVWFTMPFYLWILWPKGLPGDPSRRWLYAIVAMSAAFPAVMDLLYQNSGWRQFGYRFSNDYSILVFVLLAIGARPMGPLFGAAAAWSLVWNGFGAATFDKAQFGNFYFSDGSQNIVFQPD